MMQPLGLRLLLKLIIDGLDFGSFGLNNWLQLSILTQPTRYTLDSQTLIFSSWIEAYKNDTLEV